MKVAATTAPDYAALREIDGAHDARYEALKLARTRAIYGALYQRLQDILLLDDEGCEATITVRSHSKTLTLTAAETEACFSLVEIYRVLGNRLDALKDEIIDTLAGASPHAVPSAFEGTNDPQLILVHELCLPQAAPQATEALISVATPTALVA